MKNKIDNKIDAEVENFIKEEISESKIWAFSGIVIAVLLCKIVERFTITELDNIIYSIRNLKALDVKGTIFLILFITEIILSFVLPIVIINKSKKNAKSALIALSLLLGLILALFFPQLSFFVTTKPIIATVMFIVMTILIIGLIKKDLKKIKEIVYRKLESEKTEVLEKIRFFSVIVFFSDIIKIVILFLLMTFFF